jgi:hypothetical protein
MELTVSIGVPCCMYGLLEFRVVLVGAKNAPERPISILALSSLVALYRSASIALECDAKDFEITPAPWSSHAK